MIMEVITLVAAVVSTIMAGLALGFALICMVEVKAMQKSTHDVQFMPMPNQSDAEFAKNINAEYDDLENDSI